MCLRTAQPAQEATHLHPESIPIHHHHFFSKPMLLKTAIVERTDSFGNLQPCRVLLDDGSEASFITENCAQSLGLIKTRTDVQITGISAANAAYVHWKTTARLHSRIHSAHVDIEALILPKVTGTLPRVPSNYHQPGEIDILLGADVVASSCGKEDAKVPATPP
ncbi:DNA damage-inducible protein 1 [Orchesella cincta]|uniref:DNA damage-inducible protein 1 n=1 Tax=Orchesella cincta TaxID=48709 RepID=A0A1D2M3L1_ORCCI|nr:DNA damage-inducible protein 1 [Orchesella cincta]